MSKSIATPSTRGRQPTSEAGDKELYESGCGKQSIAFRNISGW